MAERRDDAVPVQDYPPILLATSRKDDCVHPGHALKMGYDAHFCEFAEGGQGYGKDSV